MLNSLLSSSNCTNSQEPLPSSTPTLQIISAIILAVGISLSLSTTAVAQHYQKTNLVSDLPGVAATQDTHLVNPWGLARSASSPWWVADNGTGVSTRYNGAGAALSLVVT